VNLRDQIIGSFNLNLSSNCLEELNLKAFEVVDNIPNSPCRRVDSDGEFTVENPCCYVLYFLKIDNCVLFTEDGSKCDFAVFNDNQFIFVELKRIEIGSGQSHNKRQKKRNDAYTQLENTLNIFLQRNIDLSLYQGNQRLFVIASILDYNPPITKMPVAKVSSQHAQVRFEEYQAILLTGHIYQF